MKWIKKNFYSILIWGTVLFFTILYCSLIFNHNIWTDEAFTLQLIQGNLKEIVMGTANDVHPPLYYFWSKLFYSVFGLNLQMQKVASIIPMTATFVYLSTVVRRKFGNLEAFLSLLFICCIPCSMEFAIQVRMYSLALMFVTICGVSAYLCYKEDKRTNWIFLIICATGAAYTHYFAFVSVLFIIGFLFLVLCIKKRNLLLKWFISVIGMLIIYLPWIKNFINQVTRVRENYWIPEITPETLWNYFVWTFDLDLLPGVVYGFIVILFCMGIYNLIRIIKKNETADKAAFFAMLVPTLTAFTGIIISLYKSPIYRDQYVFPTLALLALFFGFTLAKAKKYFIIPICVFLLLVGAVQYKECYRQEYKSTYVPQTDIFFKENLTDEDFVVYNWKDFGFIYEFYFPQDQLMYVEDFDFSQNFDTVYFLNSKWQPQIEQSVFDANGLKMEIIGLYGIEHNEFDLYMIYREQYTE